MREPGYWGQPPPALDPSHLRSLHWSDFASGRLEARKGEGVDCLCYATAWFVAALRFVTASARAWSAVTVVSQSMQPSVMDWP